MLSKRMRLVVLTVLLVAIAGLVGTLVITRRTTRVYVLAETLPRYRQLEERHLELRTISRTAAEEIDAITDPQHAVGRYLTAPGQRGTVLHPGLLLDELPCDRVFTATGRCIPPGREAVLVPVPATIGGMVQNQDLVNVWALYTDRGELQILLQKVPPLGLVGNGQKLALALTPDELALLAPYLNGERRENTRVAQPSLLFSLTTKSSDGYARLATFPIAPARQQDGEYRLVDNESFLPPDPGIYLNTGSAPLPPVPPTGGASAERK